MKRLTCTCVAALLAVTLTWAQSVYPTGTTIYAPDRAWNGYTVLSPLATPAVVVIDMNGNVVKRWEGYNNSAGGPARVLPGGIVMAASGARPPHQESLELIQRDFDGNVVWRFSNSAQLKTREGATIWSARQHHDWQRESLSRRLLFARQPAGRRRRQHADSGPCRPHAAERRRRAARGRPPHRGVVERRHGLGMAGERPHRRTGFRA